MNIKAVIKKNQGVVFCYLIALVLFAGFSVYMPGFASLSHIRTVFLESALIGIVALGQTLVVITGGIDLSVACLLYTSCVHGDGAKALAFVEKIREAFGKEGIPVSYTHLDVYKRQAED